MTADRHQVTATGGAENGRQPGGHFDIGKGATMPIDVKIKTRLPALRVRVPDRRFYQATATQVQKEIRQRTEKRGEDADGEPFNPYQKEYGEWRVEKGRSDKPNLSFTGKMLGSMRATATGNQGRVTISGEQGYKAWQNEEMGRRFFDISAKQVRRIFASADAWIRKTNKLKR